MISVTTIAGKAVLITGANRGIGRALSVEALNRGARQVYAGTRKALAGNGDARVTPLTLDITNAAQLRAAAEQVDSLDILVNNAGLALYDDLSDPSALQRHLEVNLLGTYAVIETFLPLLARSGGSIVNNLSVNALAPLPIIPAYSVSKAAAFSMTQSLRVILAKQGVRVHAVLTGPVDTEMTRGLDIPKASPGAVAQAIFDGVENDDDEIFPDPFSRSLAERWGSGAAKVLERQYAALLGADH
ncbi:SDR family NAD(P)-dependent oxidoreductase [Mycobacterium seoulense]|uniref:Short-chain dehydrogenase/reductase n=1 Tax=Mycobacterium seoulense TaxID=386911 RepID=A0A7I7P4C6_9MYCO|nr:SDR family NAD(P)-dependent oxidoreductase [Mycobacterium seoulense]MCV7438677.1 SDR family NAD(P)-dependent oxidoreductase [Mycobacterium seoulense]BBY03731.1 short-chain dehydrogenase/reductase [Mycobacterium seoulense]